MKKKRIIWRSFLLLLVAFLLVSAVSCDVATPSEQDTTAVDTTADTTTEEEIPTETESEPQKPAEDADDGNYRILIAADLHCTHQETWYGVAYRDRMQRWVDAVLAEHERDPIDLLLIAGDISLDHWAKKGSYTVDKVSASKVFIDDFLSQIRPHIPVFVLAGNHEQYSNEQWKTMTGNDRRGTTVVGDNLFILLDAYATDLEPNYDGDPSYTKQDVAYIREQLEKYPECKNVYLVSHYFDYKNESDSFKDLVRLEPRIKGLFQGHLHQCTVIDMGTIYGNKKIAQLGNFSYSGTQSTQEELENSFWGFRELVITPTSAITNYIIAESKITVYGKVLVDLQRRLVNPVQFY